MTDRRQVLVLGASAAAAALSPLRFAYAAEETESHGMSAFGDLKYKADFPALRLHQSKGAERRNVFADRPGTPIQP